MSIYAPPAWQADPAGVKRIGVVVGETFFAIEHRAEDRGVPLAIMAIGSLDLVGVGCIADDAVYHGCGAVWVLDDDPDLMYLKQDKYPDDAFTWHELSHEGALAGYVAQVKGEDGGGKGAPIGIYYPRINDAWGVSGLIPQPDGLELTKGEVARIFASGVALAAFTLQQQLRFSPSYTGNAILRRVLADYERHTGREIPPLSQEWRERLYELRPTPVQWRAPDAELRFWVEGARGPHLYEGNVFDVHIYDRNMSYVSSAREVPVGDPVATDMHMSHRPGLYLVMNLLEPETPAVWLWEPEMRQRVKEDTRGVYHILEGWYWPKTQQIDLRAWSDRMWEARRAARAVDSVAGRIAEAIIKKAGVSTIGRLIQHTGRAVVSSEQATRDELRILSYESDDAGELTGNVEAEVRIGRDDLVCPHWWGTIISNANERLWHAIANYAPHDTVLAYVDQFYCLVGHGILDGDPMKAGGFKYAGSFRVPVADLESLNEMTAQQLVKAFAKYQREQRNGE